MKLLIRNKLKEEKENIFRKMSVKKPIFMFLALILGASLVIAGAVLSSRSGTINVQKATLVSPMPAVINAFAGDFNESGVNYTNQANQPQNYTLMYSIAHPSFVSGDVKLRMLDSSNSLIAQSSTVNSGSINITDTNRQLNQGETFQGKFTVEFNVSAQNGSYTQKVELFGGDDQFR